MAEDEEHTPHVNTGCCGILELLGYGTQILNRNTAASDIMTMFIDSTHRIRTHLTDCARSSSALASLNWLFKSAFSVAQALYLSSNSSA